MLRPTKKQLEYMDWEIGVFFHFGIRTYYDGVKDWDGAEMPASLFNPKNLDCKQWIKAAKDGGAKFAILTTKHHDGFALWQSKYTDYSVKNAPWKDGKGDVVREYTDACRKYNMKVGLYYSTGQVGFDEISEQEYDDYVINQVTELLTGYGKIDYLWFDMCGSETHTYNQKRIEDKIREIQPDILINGIGKTDVCWTGNEEGLMPDGGRCHNVSKVLVSVLAKQENKLDFEKFMPFECDCKIRRDNWFFSSYDEHRLRSVEDLVGLYYYSVGRDANLLLNIAPNRDGVIPQKDAEVFKKFKKKVHSMFSQPINAVVTKDKNRYTIEFDEPTLINHIVLEENLENGQSVKAFELRHLHWEGTKVGVCFYKGNTIGHKYICTFPSIFAKKIWIDITDYEGEHEIKRITAYNVCM